MKPRASQLLILSLALSLPPLLPAQNLGEARRLFAKGARNPAGKEQQAAIQALIDTADPSAAKDFERALAGAERHHALLTRKLADLGRKRKSIWKSVDKQSDAGRPVYFGSVTEPRKKEDLLNRKMAPLFQSLTRLEGWHRRLLAGYGRLLEKLPPPDRQKIILRLAAQAEKAPHLDEKLRVVHVLKGTRGSTAREVLSELALRSEMSGVRTAALDALGARGEREAVPTLTKALRDGSLNVQIAACRALKKIPSARGIAPLIAALGREKGLMVDEVQQTLEDITGITFFDNQPLWQEWWQKNGKQLTGLLTSLRVPGGSPMAAASTVAASGFLTGALQILRTYGFGPHTSLFRKGTSSLKPADGAGGSAEAERARRARLQAAAEAIATRRKSIRKRAFGRLLFSPFLRAEKLDRRLEMLHLLGPIRDPRALNLLLRLSSDAPFLNPATKQPYPAAARLRFQEAAVIGLGLQGGLPAVTRLRRILDDPGTPQNLALKAAAALGHIPLKMSVWSLLRVYGDQGGAVRSAIVAALKELTGEDHGQDYLAWKSWFDALPEDWKPNGAAPSKEEAAKADKGGGTRFYGIKTHALHPIYIIDVSGSMNQPDAAGQSRIAVAKKELIQSIRSLPREATFNIIFYNSDHSTWKKRMVTASGKNKKAAVQWVKAIQARGATNIFDPLEHAFRLGGRGTFDKHYGVVLDTIFFLSDGQPNRGRIINPARILQEVQRMNALKKVKINTIGIGRSHAASFMRRLAEITGGTYISRS